MWVPVKEQSGMGAREDKEEWAVGGGEDRGVVVNDDSDEYAHGAGRTCRSMTGGTRDGVNEEGFRRRRREGKWGKAEVSTRESNQHGWCVP